MYRLKATNYFVKYNPWSNVYGMARSLIAFGTLLTLLFNDTNALFKSVQGISECPFCFGPASISIFCLLKVYDLEISKWISILVLIIVIFGWRPRVTGIFHWWITFSLFSTSSLLDGGDQAAAILTLLLIPITLTDGRKNHWNNKNEELANQYALIFANVSYLVIRVQIALIYFHASVGKIGITEWIDGTALYYFTQDPLFSVLPGSILVVFKSPFILTFCTWSVIVFELALFVGLFIPRRKCTPLLYAGLIFHILIIFVFGLVSFFLSMAGALILLLYPLARSKRVPMEFKKESTL